jgi:hypothetical protein
VVPAAGPHEQHHFMTGPGKRAAHETANSTRSENPMLHRLPPQIFAPYSI